MIVEDPSKLKILLEDGAISQEEFDKQKTSNFKMIRKNNDLWLIIGIIAVIVVCISIVSGWQTANTSTANIENGIDKAYEKYIQELPIVLTTYMYDNIIGIPQLKCTITNNSKKEIAAIKMYFVPRDVYGEEINTLLTTHELFTDTPILPDKSNSLTWSLLDGEIKEGDLYVYSIYFSDGSEWGDRNASVSEIKEYAYKFKTKY